MPPLQPTDNEKSFPTKDGWFKVENALRDDTWEYIRLTASGKLVVHRFGDHCSKFYNSDTPVKYCCAANGEPAKNGK